MHYEGAGNDTPKDVVRTDDSTLTRTVTIDKVTGEVLETSKWTGKKEYDDVDTRVVNGYYADTKAAGASKVTTDDVSRAKDGVITNETTVTYHPMGKIIPVDKNGNPIPGSKTPIFNNDPNDPTKATTTDSPIIPGYHLDNPDESSITPDDPGKDRKVVYVADTQNLVVQVFDKDSKTPDQPLDTTKTGATVEFTGDSFTNFPTDVATNIDALIKYYEARGYKVKTKPSPDELSAKFDGDKDITQYLKLVLTHDTEIVTGENPKTPDDKIPNTNQNYPGGLTETDLAKTITRTIIVHMPNGSTKEIKQKVVYTRTATVDSVTKEVTYTDWTSKNSNWSEYQSPDIPGYTVDIEKVELAKVPVDGHDVTVEINYTADPVPDEPVNPSNPGNPGTTMPDQPQQPGKPTDPTKPSEPNKPSNPGRPTNPNHPTKPTKPVTPAKPDQTHDQYSKVNGETDLNGFVHGISDEKAGAVAGASDNAQAGAKKLPQTSGESGWQASLLGMGLFFISLFGFKKKKEDE